MFNILVTEDDKNTRLLLRDLLTREGYHVFCAVNGKAALEVLDEQQIDLIVLDIMMPEMDGYAFTSELRENDVLIPILMLTAKQLPDDKRRGFRVGTDDFLTKPFDTEELLLRIKAILRRSQIVNRRKLVVGGLTLDYDELSVAAGGEKQLLPQKEFQLLFLLLSHPNKIFTRLQLMDEIWGMTSESGDNTLNVHISRLRSRFDGYRDFSLVSVRGLGYKAVVNDEK